PLPYHQPHAGRPARRRRDVRALQAEAVRRPAGRSHPERLRQASAQQRSADGGGFLGILVRPLPRLRAGVRAGGCRPGTAAALRQGRYPGRADGGGPLRHPQHSRADRLPARPGARPAVRRHGLPQLRRLAGVGHLVTFLLSSSATLLRWLGRLGRHELPLLLAMTALAGGTWAFLELAGEVLDGGTLDFDARLLLALRNPADLSDPLGPGWLEEMGRDFTALGGTGVLVLLGASVTGYLLLSGHHRTALFTVIALTGGWLLSSLLKLGFDRPRPDLVPHGSIVYTASFPSGHSMMAAVTYLTLAIILARAQP